MSTMTLKVTLKPSNWGGAETREYTPEGFKIDNGRGIIHIYDDHSIDHLEFWRIGSFEFVFTKGENVRH